jgi:hypothetical protein
MPSVQAIPELEGSTLDSERHDQEARTYEVLCHVVESGAIRRFQLRCEGVRQVRHRVQSPRLEPWNYIEITEAYREPLPDGGILVSLDLWSESEWIEIDCLAARVTEIDGSPDHPEHLARITWSDALVRAGLPALLQTIDPAWVDGAVPIKDEGWSLICRFERAPNEQGNPSVAFVRFLVGNAPEHLLKQGAVLRLFERGTLHLATLEILR